jgi:hypothetical protein
MSKKGFDYAELVLEDCTGTIHIVKFDDGTFMANKAAANQAAAALTLIGMSGREVGHFKKNQDPQDWLSLFPDWSHLARITVHKCRHDDDEVVLHMQWIYKCSHPARNGASLKQRPYHHPDRVR